MCHESEAGEYAECGGVEVDVEYLMSALFTKLSLQPSRPAKRNIQARAQKAMGGLSRSLSPSPHPTPSPPCRQSGLHSVRSSHHILHPAPIGIYQGLYCETLSLCRTLPLLAIPCEECGFALLFRRFVAPDRVSSKLPELEDTFKGLGTVPSLFRRTVSLSSSR